MSSEGTKKRLGTSQVLKSWSSRSTLHEYRFTSSAVLNLERAMGFEPTTTCLGSKDSTPELRPLAGWNPTLEFVGKSRKARLRDSFYNGKLPPANLQPARPARRDFQHRGGIDFLLAIDLHPTLNDEAARLALAGN